MERSMPPRNTPPNAAPRKLERTTPTRATSTRSASAPSAASAASPAGAASPARGASAQGGTNPARGGTPPRSPLQRAIDAGKPAPKTKAPPAKPTQKAIDRWEGESPAPSPEPPAPNPAPAPADLSGAVRALLEAVELLQSGAPKSDAATSGRVKEALERCRTALGPPQGQGRMPKPAQQAHAAQRADPEKSPHFGG